MFTIATGLQSLQADPQGHFYGPLAHAYACGAQMAVTNEVPWNIVFSSSPNDVEQKREMLRSSWGVHDAGGWRSTLDTLLGDQSSDQCASIVMGIRRQLVGYYRGLIDPGTWQGAIANWCGQNGCRDLQPTLMETMGRIVRYEASLMGDGVLMGGDYVRDMIAYDFGRAVNFARWGVHAQYVGPRAAEAFILHAGAQSRRHYNSWAEVSAGYILGRSLRFDNDEYGEFYTEPVAAHHTLVSHPQSPWLNLPFHM